MVYVLTSWDEEIWSSQYVKVFWTFRDASEYAIRYFNHETHSIKVDQITSYFWDVNMVVEDRAVKVGTIVEEQVR